jgi:signal recognition particle subunit SRP68
MSKIPESLALYQRAQAYLVQTKQTIQQIRGFSNDSLLIVSNENISQLEQAIHSGTWKARAAWYLENGDDTVTDKMESLTLNASSETALIDQLDSYPSALSQGTLHLVDFPPKFQPVACKPFYFDLAANHIKYPDALAERTEKASGGIWKLFGFGK